MKLMDLRRKLRTLENDSQRDALTILKMWLLKSLINLIIRLANTIMKWFLLKMKQSLITILKLCLSFINQPTRNSKNARMNLSRSNICGILFPLSNSCSPHGDQHYGIRLIQTVSSLKLKKCKRDKQILLILKTKT